MTHIKPRDTAALSEHELSHVLSGLDDWQREEGRELLYAEIIPELHDTGYGGYVTQIWHAWCGRTSDDDLSFSVDVSDLGEGVVVIHKVKDVGTGDPGVQIGMQHIFMSSEAKGARIAISADEARAVADGLQKAATAVDGVVPDVEPAQSVEQIIVDALRHGPDDFMSHAIDAMSVANPAVVREALVTAVASILAAFNLHVNWLPEVVGHMAIEEARRIVAEINSED